MKGYMLFISEKDLKIFQSERKLGKTRIREVSTIEPTGVKPGDSSSLPKDLLAGGKPIDAVFLADIDLFVRTLKFPFPDVHKARLATPALLSGTLPFDGEFLFDLIPGPKEGEHHLFTALVAPKKQIDRRLSAIPEGTQLGTILPAALLVAALKTDEKSHRGKRGYLDSRVFVTIGEKDEHLSLKIFSPRRLTEVLDMSDVEEIYATDEDAAKKSPEKVKLLTEGINRLIESFVSDRSLAEINLLSLESERKKSEAARKRWKTALFLSAILLVTSAVLLVEGMKLANRKKAEALKTHVSKIFKSSMGNVPMVDPVSQLEEKIKKLEAEVKLLPGESAKLTDMLFALSSSLSPREDLTVTSFKYIRGKGTFQGISGSQKTINDLISKLEAKGFKAVLVDSGPAAESGKIKFSVEIERK